MNRADSARWRASGLVSIGGDSSLIGKDLGNAGWSYVAGQSNRLQIVVNLVQTKVIRTLVDSVFVVALSDRRRRLSVVSRDPPFSISWIGKRLDMTVHVPLSRVAIGSRSTLPKLVCPRFLSVDVFPWTIDGFVVTFFGEPFLVSGTLTRTGYELAFCRLLKTEIVPWRERDVHVYSMVSRSGLTSFVQGHQ